jgi:PPOX class probable F420-dependent enzyme
MIGAMASTNPILSAAQRSFLAQARRAVLSTIAPDGRPRLVPICFVVADDSAVVYTPIDEKPKQTVDPLALARVRDIASDPRVAVIVDRWDEDWTRLAWLRVDGRAGLIVPDDPMTAGEHGWAVGALRDRYPQYAEHRIEVRPIIRITVDRTVAWGSTDRQSPHLSRACNANRESTEPERDRSG